MRFNEIPRAIERFTQQKLHERERRLTDPRLQQQLENMKLNMRDDIYNACLSTGKAAGRLTCAPLIGLYEGFIGTPVKTFVHNSSVRHARQKREYPNVFATTVTETLTQYVKGVLDAGGIILHLTKFTGRVTALTGRYLIGK